MKLTILITLFFYLSNQFTFAQSNKVNTNQFQLILDSLKVEGTILIYDSNKNLYYSNNFERANEGFIPASTFKIPNSIIGLELGILTDENYIFKWDGKKRYLESWEKDLTLKEAFKLSCVPCYQSLALEIGFNQMKKNLKKINYPKMIFNKKNLNTFWLKGKSKISSFEQVEFLKKFYFSELPITEKTYQIVKNIMINESEKNYILSGKTGWATPNNQNIGWFVGYLETNNNTYFFAVNITSTINTNMDNFASLRIVASKEAFKYLNLIE